MRGAPRKERAETIAREGKPAGSSELIEAIDGEITRSRELLEDFKRQMGSATS